MAEETKIKTISINGGEEISFDKFMEIVEAELDRRAEKARIAAENRLGLK